MADSLKELIAEARERQRVLAEVGQKLYQTTLGPNPNEADRDAMLFGRLADALSAQPAPQPSADALEQTTPAVDIERLERIAADRQSTADDHAFQARLSEEKGFAGRAERLRAKSAEALANAAAIRSAISSQTRAGGGEWRPIETAPKDGTPILAWCVHPHARWATDDKEWCAPVVTQWIEHNGGGWTWHGMAGTFTHWQPLPSAPSLLGGGR